MKKFKIISLIILILLSILFLFATCKKTKALENGFRNYTTTISERELDKYNLVAIYDLGQASTMSSSDIFILINTSNFYININNSNTLSLVKAGNYETVSLTSRLIEVDLVYDVDGLYTIIYEIKYTTQSNQSQVPVIDGISRTMKTRFALPSNINNTWSNGDLSVILMTDNLNYQANFLMNYAYISYSDTPQVISNWVSNQLSNYLTYNNLINIGYYSGYDVGYDVGLDEGVDIGYSNGYDEGEEIGYNYGYFVGRNEGLQEGQQTGYNIGYNIGYTDGQAGNTAITPIFNTLSGVFSVVGSVLAIELVPNVPIGVFILVPLFFAAVGLILWIWRRN